MTIDLTAPLYHPIFGMPIRTLFLCFIVTFMPWAVPFCMPISGARPPLFEMFAWVMVKASGGDARRLTVKVNK